jgi:hypothetical protein
MRKRDVRHSVHHTRAAHRGLERDLSPKSIDRKRAHEQDHTRPEERELLLEPRRAERDLSWRRPTIAATARRFSWEALRDRGAIGQMGFVDAGRREPAPELCAGATAERLTRRELDGAWRLADDGDTIGNRSSDDRPRLREVSRIDALRACLDASMKLG